MVALLQAPRSEVCRLHRPCQLPDPLYMQYAEACNAAIDFNSVMCSRASCEMVRGIHGPERINHAAKT
jgi:hypothetical protein